MQNCALWKRFIMSAKTQADAKKWVQASVAIVCLIFAYVLISFFNQMGEWFELESHIKHFSLVAQGISVVLALAVFIVIIRHPVSSTFLAEVYEEAIKVVWPDKNETVKHTVGVMIAVTIVGFILGFFDFAAGYFLSLLN